MYVEQRNFGKKGVPGERWQGGVKGRDVKNERSVRNGKRGDVVVKYTRYACFQMKRQTGQKKKENSGKRTKVTIVAPPPPPTKKEERERRKRYRNQACLHKTNNRSRYSGEREVGTEFGKELRPLPKTKQERKVVKHAMEITNQKRGRLIGQYLKSGGNAQTTELRQRKELNFRGSPYRRHLFFFMASAR